MRGPISSPSASSNSDGEEPSRTIAWNAIIERPRAGCNGLMIASTRMSTAAGLMSPPRSLYH
jgi:hypothetical protein